MRLSDISVQRPVLAMVIAALIIAFGLLALNRLPLQEYPTVDPPIVSIDTRYPRRLSKRGRNTYYPSAGRPYCRGRRYRTDHLSK